MRNHYPNIEVSVYELDEVSSDDSQANAICTLSIAVSLKRIADSLESPSESIDLSGAEPSREVHDRALAALEGAQRSIDLVHCGPVQFLQGLRPRSLAELDHLEIELWQANHLKRAALVKSYAAVVRDFDGLSLPK